MPLPPAPESLFHHTDDPTLLPQADFTNSYDNWYEVFGGSAVFFITGFQEALRACGIAEPSTLLEGLEPDGTAILGQSDFPAEWRNLISSGQHVRQATNRFSPDQLRFAKEGTRPMLLSKILISLYLLNRAAQAKGLDLFHQNGFIFRIGKVEHQYRLRIYPAMHYVDTFDEEVWRALPDGNRINMHNQTGNRHAGELFRDIAFHKRSTTFDIAKVIYDNSFGHPIVVKISHKYPNFRAVRRASWSHRLSA